MVSSAFTPTLSSPNSSPTKTNPLIRKCPLLFPFLHFTTHKFPRRAISCSAPKPFTPTTEQNFLKAVADFDGAGNSPLCVRTYENDLTRLTLTGSVDFQQALTAAAADGGEAASEHISAGMPAMVVETVFPGPSDERSTVSTRLFLPARKVMEKARKLKSTLTKEILSSTTSTNILAMTFRQVILQHLLNIELVLFIPGAERNMDDLETPREQVPSFAMTLSDERAISAIAEVLYLSALESTKRCFLNETPGGVAMKFFPWFQKYESIVSKDSTVTLYSSLESEIVENANILLQKFSSERANYRPREGKWTSNWLSSSAYSKLEQTGGPEYIAWLSEYLPAYKLQIYTEKLGDVKLEGWKESATNIWEVSLTHTQLVGLSDILDMYYDDVYSLPNKQLLSGGVAKSFNSSSSKRSISMSKAILMVLASGIFLVAIQVLSQRYLPHLPNRKNYHQEIYPANSCDDVISVQHQIVESNKVEDNSVSIVKRIKEFNRWPGDIMMGSGGSAWIGELPICLRREVDSNDLDLNSSSTPSEGIGDEIKAAAQDIASYQVVMSVDGKIVEFQPTSPVAVNEWAANPLAKELYGGKKLSPDLIERGLNISHPGDVVLELLMSVNPQSSFALVRPVTKIR